MEGFSVQIRKTAGIRGKAEGELVGVERLNFAVVLLVELAVFAVAEQGIAGCRHLGADLVGSAGDQFAFDKRQPVFRLQDLISRGAGLRALLRRAGDVDAVFDGVLKEIPFQRALRRLRRAVDDAKIALVNLAVLDLLVENAQRLGGFCGNDNAAGVAVDAVAQRGRKRVFLARAPLAFGV